MDSNLQRLISEYQILVSRRFSQLRNEIGFDVPDSNVAWACNGIEPRGRLTDGSQYFKHGYGCAVKGATDSVDFDIGAKGEINGFDASRLWGFAVGSNKEWGFGSEKEIAAGIKQAATNGELRYSGYMLYYLNEKETNQSPHSTLARS